tara:strand:- start:155 stop:703 length:549 start_codon:yes stop_codon:yes gene_type:complete
MNDSLDLRNRIQQMRKSNNLIVTEKKSINNNLMSKFESSIKDDNHNRNSNSEKYIKKDVNKEIIPNTHKNNSENITQNKESYENKNIKNFVDNNEAQFLMLANKFNEAVEVILELSEKVEKLERNISQETQKQKQTISHSSFLNFKLFIFILILSIIILGLFTFPFDLSLIKLIIDDVFSNI